MKQWDERQVNGDRATKGGQGIFKWEIAQDPGHNLERKKGSSELKTQQFWKVQSGTQNHKLVTSKNFFAAIQRKKQQIRLFRPKQKELGLSLLI